MNRVVNARRSQGFTLIELVLAMAFISVLLLAIAMTIIQVGVIYNKGMTLKEINQAGRAIGDDVKRTTAASEPIVLANDYVTNSGGGRLCLGAYSYIWNTTAAIQRNDPNLTTYASDPTKQVNFVKVADSAKIYCSKNSSGALVYRQIRANPSDASLDDTEEAQELLPAGDHSLGINQFTLPATFAVSDSTTGQTMYTLMYTLGSGPISAMNSDQSACLGAGEPESDLTYCSVQQFTLVLRTGSKVN